MKAIILQEPGKIRLGEAKPPQPLGQDEALVRVHRVGVCGTDIHAYKGEQPFFSYPRILGHELAVEILTLGASTQPHPLHIGDLCTVEPYMNCGQCIACRRGYSNACVRMSVLGVHQDGGMQERLTVPLHKLHRANLPLEQIALVEMLSVGAHAVRRAKLQAGENVLVIGAGPIGMGTMQFAQLMGSRVIAMDMNPARLAFCRTHLNIAATLELADNPLGQLQDLLGGELPTAVFDATGSLSSMQTAFHYVAHSGRLIYVGLIQGNILFDDTFFHSREITLLASRNATSEDFKQVITALETQQIRLDGWITHQASVEQFPAQFPAWLHPQAGLVKAMVNF